MENKYAKYELYTKKRPHVVILGAGASCATIPNGDKYGKKISAMSGFIEKLGLSDIISRVTLNTKSDNLEIFIWNLMNVVKVKMIVKQLRRN